MIAGSSTFRPFWGESSRICAVSCMLYGMVRKHHSTAIIQEQLQLPRIWPLSLGGLPVHTLVPSLNCGANAALASVQALV